MANEKRRRLGVRRVVTGHDDYSKESIVLWDDEASNIRYPEPHSVSALIWSTDQTPADISVGRVEDMSAKKLGTPPPKNGTKFGVTEFAPGAIGTMHRTETTDYVVVLSGELELETERSTVKLRAGDVVVQRGTKHAWHNRSTRKPARVAVTMIDAKPLGIGNPIPFMGTIVAHTSPDKKISE